jgi:hypothetical protein
MHTDRDTLWYIPAEKSAAKQQKQKSKSAMPPGNFILAFPQELRVSLLLFNGFLVVIWH